ncbi:GrpB family protein, partial [Cellulomonas septica]|nr:GrpB family protein [Cellulomonas septica]
MLIPAEDLHDAAVEVVDAERAKLAAACVPGELVWVGASSVPGALTRGDVDLHLRVPPEEFDAAVALVRRDHAVVHPEIWCATLATFAVDAPLPAGLAVTPLGSEHDVRFTRTWALLRADPALLAEHNRVKAEADEAAPDEYEARKSAFFDRVLADGATTDPAGDGTALTRGT